MARARSDIGFSVLIADGDDYFRDLLRRHLGSAVVVVGDADDGDEAVRLAKRLRPDVVLMDMAMPVIGGPEAARRIKADRAETKVVLLTSATGDRELLGDGGSGSGTCPADAVLPREKVRVGILSQLGRIARAARTAASSRRKPNVRRRRPRR